jgi:hypothetical protein
MSDAKSPLLEFLEEDETAVVFDVDGVLAVYEFGERSHSACPDWEWESYVREHDPYAFSRPVRQLQEFIAAKDPSRVFACSVAADYERHAKRDFVLRNYRIPRENIQLVSSKPEKLAYLSNVRKKLDLPERRVALVEDTVSTLDLVYETTGFTTVHVSSFFSYGE